MSLYELVDRTGDTGMLVGGAGVDISFRHEADEHNRPDERLLTITNPEDLLDHDMLVQAAVGRLATRVALAEEIDTAS